MVVIMELPEEKPEQHIFNKNHIFKNITEYNSYNQGFAKVWGKRSLVRLDTIQIQILIAALQPNLQYLQTIYSLAKTILQIPQKFPKPRITLFLLFVPYLTKKNLNRQDRRWISSHHVF